MLMQAYDNEKGAGTSPYTFLRAIGPEPWNAVHVEPFVVHGRPLRGKPKTVLPPIPSGDEPSPSNIRSTLSHWKNWGSILLGARYPFR